MAHAVGDRMVEKMLSSIQTDEARHSQIGPAVLRTVIRHDPEYAQVLVDKWFWRTWRSLRGRDGIHDGLSDAARGAHGVVQRIRRGVDRGPVRPHPRRARIASPLVLGRVRRVGRSLPPHGLRERLHVPGHHMVQLLAAGSGRASVAPFEISEHVGRARSYLGAGDRRWRQSGPGVEWFDHGTTPPGFCDLCQLVLCAGTPKKNSAKVVDHAGKRFVFCSEPCAWIFGREPERYASHAGLVRRILSGQAPANLLSLVREYFGLTPESWGKDVRGGDYPWLRPRPATSGSR